MRNMIFSAFALAALAARPVPGGEPSCTEEDLLAASTVAFEGIVLDVACGAPYDSKECVADPAGTRFQPRLVADCTATVLVTRTLKGGAAPGAKEKVPFLQLYQESRGAICAEPGKAKLDFRLDSRIRWYDAPACAPATLRELEPPFIRGDASEDGTVDVTDAVRMLEGLFLGGPWPAAPSAMDANGDGSADLADPIYLLFHLFAGGPQPPEPFWIGPEVRIAIAYDNDPFVPGLATDWGFSSLVEAGAEKVMVDAGPDGTKLLADLAAMGIDPAGVPVVFTHIHDDHTKGAASLLGKTGKVPVYIPPSFPASFRTTVKPLASKVVDVTASLEIVPGILTTGELAGSTKEQSIFVRTGGGIVLVMACAHGGIAATVREAKRQSGAEVALLLGGLHLFQSSDAEVKAAIADLRSLGVRKVAPCHCTGDRAKELLKAEYGDDFIEIGSGARVTVRR